MEFLTYLWLPILVSAVLVFVASSLIHMLTPLHKNDFGKLAGEEKILEAMRAEGVKPGLYAFPRATSMKDMSTPEMVQKYQAGPVGYMTVDENGPPKFGRSLVLWFFYSLIIGFLVAYVAFIRLEPGTAYKVVFRMTGTVAVIAYAIGHVHESIWKGQPFSVTFRHMLGGVIYGLLTGGVFGWLWPDV
jgi:hypothetical protein